MNVATKTKIKDWFIITRIRILNFVKEHKYVSAFVGVLLLSLVIALIVKAATTNEINSATASIKSFALSGTESNEVPNFSDVTYKLQYDVNEEYVGKTIDQITYKITTDKYSEIGMWKASESGEFEMDESNKTFTYTVYDVELSSSMNQNFTFMVQNAASNTKMKIESVSIKLGSNGQDVVNTPQNTEITSTYTNTISLSSLILESGIAKKTESGRETYFGIVLGLTPSDVQNLKGKYIKADEGVPIYLTAQDNGVNKDIATSEGSYGVINEDKDSYFVSLPSLSNQNSKEKTKLTAVSKDDTYDDTSVITPSITIPDVSDIEVDDHNISSEERKAMDSYLSSTTSGVRSECVIENDKLVGLKYTASDKDGSTILIKSIGTAKDKNKVALRGPRTLYLESVDKFVEFGTTSTSDLDTRFSENNNNDIENDKLSLKEIASKNGTYYEKYLDESGDVVSIRKIIIGEIKQITTSTVTAKKYSYSYQGADFKENIKYGDKEIVCPSDKCNATGIDTGSNGDKKLTYTINIDNYTFTLNKILRVSDKIFELRVNPNITNNFELYKINNQEIYAIGSYYVVVPSSLASTVTLKASLSKDFSNAVSASRKNEEVSKGTNTFENNLYVDEGGSLTKVTEDSKTSQNDNYFTAALGEVVEVHSKVHYGIDADNDFKQLEMLLDVNNLLTPTAYSENIESSDVSDDTSEPKKLYYDLSVSNSNTQVDLSDFKSEIKYCTSKTNCTIDPAAYDGKSTITNIKVVITPQSGDAVTKGTTFTLKTKYIVSEDTSNISQKSISSTLHTNISINTNSSDSKDVTSYSAYLTPYKVRSLVSIDNDLTDITLDASSNASHTATISTGVTSPAMKTYSNIFGYTSIKSLPIVVTLPNGINYVYNDTYQIKPQSVIKNSNGQTVITYKYSGAAVNTWLDDIMFDFNIDVTTPNKSILTIVTKVGNHSDNTSIENDLSSNVFKTIENKITVQNVEDISYGQYAKNSTNIISNINKNASFQFETKIFNNKDNSFSNVNIYTILPSNENGSEFKGSYTISNIPSDAYCTSDSVTNKSNVTSANYSSCDKFKSGSSYSGITAYKVTYSDVGASQAKVTDISIQTKDNEADDYYKFDSYIEYGNKINEFKPLKIDVISKKITGTVWEDFDGNGLMDDDELKIDSVTLTLHNVDTGETMETTPDKKGNYTFSGFERGNYYISAEFNKDKYSATTVITDYEDPSKVSVFNSKALTDDSNANDEIDTLSDDEEEISDDEENSDDIDSDEDDNNIITEVRTDDFVVTDETRRIENMNLGLALRKSFEIKLNKYITRAEVTNALGVVTKKDYGNTKLAKLDVKDINNVNIKVVYTIEVQNVKYYPGYITMISDIIPDGMEFNPKYDENKGWELLEDGTLANYSLQNELIYENEKKYLTVAFDITRKEAGSFINTASVDKLAIFGGEDNEAQ